MRFLWACLLALPVFAETPPTIAIAPASLSFSYSLGSQYAFSQSVLITSAQTSLISLTRPAADTWLLLPNGQSASGSAPGVFQVGFDPSGLNPGTYTSAVTVHTTQGYYALPVSLQVSGGPVLVAYPPSLLFQSTAVVTGFPGQNVAVAMSGGGAAAVTSIPTVPWLTAVPASSYVSVTPNVGKASPGLNSGAVKFTAPGAFNNPLIVPVIYLVGSLNTGGPLSLNPAALTFTGAGSQMIAVSGPAFTAAGDSPWLSANAAGQTLTVAVNPSGLAAGTYQGTVALTANGVVELLPVTVTVAATPTPNLTQVANAASYATGGIAPGEVVTLFGTNLGPSSLTPLKFDENGFVSSNLAGVQVLFNGKAAPMIYASAGQLAAVAPYELDGQGSATVQVVVNGQGSNILNVPVVAAAPGVFTADASGAGPAAALQVGSTVAIYLTGGGQTNPAGQDGQVTGATPPASRLPVTATVDGQPAAVTFAGEAPSLVSGVMQVNLTIPPGTRAGAVPLVVSVGGTPSQNGVTVSVR